MSSKNRRFMKTLLTPNGGCGCAKPKPSQVHLATPKPKISIYHNTIPTSLTSDQDFTSTTISEPDTTHHDNKIHNNKSIKNQSISKPCKNKLIDSIAIEKESNDPYNDFLYSMLQMIVEKDIYSENDLQHLLRCFLQLNAPFHHHFIVQAFIEICEETFPKKFDDVGRGCDGEPSRRNHIIDGKSL